MKKNITITAIAIICLIAAASVNAANQSGSEAKIQQNTQTVNEGTDVQIQSQTQIDLQTQTSGTSAGQSGTASPTPATGGTAGQVKIDAGVSTGNGAQTGSDDGNQNKDQDQIKDQIKDQAKDQIKDQEKLQDGTGDGPTQQQDRDQVKDQQQLQDGSGAGTAVASQRRSNVANAVQQMIQVAEKNEGVGEQIRTIAQAQNQNQTNIDANLEKIQSRSGIAKFFIGPDYGQIKNAQKTLEQNRQQIEQLNQIKSQITNEGDQQILAEQIQILEQANQEVQDSLDKSQEGFSLLGWLFKMFAK